MKAGHGEPTQRFKTPLGLGNLEWLSISKMEWSKLVMVKTMNSQKEDGGPEALNTRSLLSSCLQ